MFAICAKIHDFARSCRFHRTSPGSTVITYFSQIRRRSHSTLSSHTSDEEAVALDWIGASTDGRRGCTRPSEVHMGGVALDPSRNGSIATQVQTNIRKNSCIAHV